MVETRAIRRHKKGRSFMSLRLLQYSQYKEEPSAASKLPLLLKNYHTVVRWFHHTLPEISVGSYCR